MKKLVFAVLVSFAAMQAGGCIIVSDDDDGGGGDGLGSFDVTWSLDPGCPIGSNTVQVLTQEVDVNGDPIGGLAGDDLFDCDAGGGTTQLFPLGDYELTLNVLTDDETTLLAQSEPQLTDIRVDGEVVPISFSLLTEEGFFGLTWTVNGLAADATSCNDVAAMNLSVVLTGGVSGESQFACPAGEGVTDEFPLGDYTIAIDLLDENMLAITDESINLANESLTVGNVVEDLGDFDMIVTP